MLGDRLGALLTVIDHLGVGGACEGLEVVAVCVGVPTSAPVNSSLLQQGDEFASSEVTRSRRGVALACGWDRSGCT